MTKIVLVGRRRRKPEEIDRGPENPIEAKEGARGDGRGGGGIWSERELMTGREREGGRATFFGLRTIFRRRRR